MTDTETAQPDETDDEPTTETPSAPDEDETPEVATDAKTAEEPAGD